MKYTGKALERTVTIHEGQPNWFQLPPFLPSPGFIKMVNASLDTHWPLLITGERERCIWLGKSIAYELYDQSFPDYYLRAKIKKGATFQSFIYQYDRELRKDDLEYHRFAPEEYPLRPRDHYYHEGIVIEGIRLRNEGKAPILEFNDLHLADPEFVHDLMEFYLLHRAVNIWELEKNVARNYYGMPQIIFTAEKGYQLPEGYEGIIYSYELPPLDPDTLLAEMMGNFHDPDHPEAGQVKALLQAAVELFFLVKDASLTQGFDLDRPHSILALEAGISLKLRAIENGETSFDEAIQSFQNLIASQKELGASFPLRESIPAIQGLLRQSNIRGAIKNLELILESLPEDEQETANMLIARFHFLQNQEALGVENSFTLWPQQNKLVVDLMRFLAQLEQD